MGSLISPVVANIYMEMVEQLAFSSAQNSPRMWKRYVDYTFCIMDKRHVEEFLSHLNRLQFTIQFTMVVEENGALPFLDTLIQHGEGGAITIGV